MKKIIALLLACMMLFLTACNQTPPNETTSGNPQNQEQPKDSDWKDTIIKNGGANYLLDTPSRVVFSQLVTDGQNRAKYNFYYSKADGKAYVYCFDPLCDHSGEKCFACPLYVSTTRKIALFDLYTTVFINNRFYGVANVGQIYSFAFDGSDLRIEYGQESYTNDELNELQHHWDSNIRAYGSYIYIYLKADENGNPHTLRFNTETKEMEDLTEKTGNFIHPDFFFNGEIYGRGADRLWYKSDLELNEIQSIDTVSLSSVFYGSMFFSVATEGTDYKTKKVVGLKIYDVKTGETTLISNEMLGLEAPKNYIILDADENYIYFYPYKQSKIGIDVDGKGREFDVYKNNEGKLYRVKHDGTECVCIYDNPDFEFDGSAAGIVGDKLLIWVRYCEVYDNGYAIKNTPVLKAGTISPDGTIEKFEDVELIY